MNTRANYSGNTERERLQQELRDVQRQIREREGQMQILSDRAEKLRKKIGNLPFNG